MQQRRTAVAVAAAVGLGALLVRAAYAGEALFHDEAATVLRYVDGAASAPWTTVDENNHLLFTVLAKATRSLLGDAPWVFRLWGMVPAALAAALLTAAVVRWRGVAAGVLAGGLLAATPFVVDSTAAGRGYGLVTLGATLVAASAFDVVRRQRMTAAIGFVVASAAWPLAAPVLGATWLAQSAASRRPDRRTLLAMAGATVVVAAWWAPVAGDYLAAVRGLRTTSVAVAEQLRVTASPFLRVAGPVPIELLESLTGVTLPVTLALVVLVAGGVAAAALLLRDAGRGRVVASGLAAGVAVLVVVVTAGGLFVELRFAIVLVPSAAALVGPAIARVLPEHAGTAVATLAIGLLLVSSTIRSAVPREDYVGVARALADRGVTTALLATPTRLPGHLVTDEGPREIVVLDPELDQVSGVPADVLAANRTSPDEARQLLCDGDETVAVVARSDRTELFGDGPCERPPDEVLVVEARYQPDFLVLVQEPATGR